MSQDQEPKPLPEQPEPVVNPEDESIPKVTTEEGDGDDDEEGDHPKKRPGDPAP